MIYIRKKERFLMFFFIFLGVLISSLLISLLLLKYLAKEQIKRSDNLFASYKLATELRQSSSDLTKMARLYVLTGEKKYKDFFYEILSVRNGISPRPLNYNEVFWDIVSGSEKRQKQIYGEPRSLVSMMMAQGLTLNEYELLRLAEERSNALGEIEIKAMNMRDGLYDEGSGTYKIKGKPNLPLAIQLVSNDEYVRRKASIMIPLEKFFTAVNKRTVNDYVTYNRWVEYAIIFATVLAFLSTVLMIISINKALNTLAQATKENELLLLNIFPASIAERLKKGEGQIADEFHQASVMFADIVGFTTMTAVLGVKKIVPILNSLFEIFDTLTEQYGVEKVKTIGDNYMAVAGVPTPSFDHAHRLADYALSILEKLNEFNIKNGTQIQLRIGITYGPVVAGIIGHKKFIYDVWGDVVNTASRMESTSLPNKIQITEKMAFMLEDNFIVEPREPTEVKGLGILSNYFLIGRKTYKTTEH